MQKGKINYGHIKTKRQWNAGLKRFSGLKGKYWRSIPINSTLYWWLIKYLPTANFGSDKYGKRVFQQFRDFDNGEQAKVLRAFCADENLKSIKFHTLRACWATQALRSGIPATDLMMMGGWRDYKTMMIYIRLAGLECVGATEGLNFEVSTGKKGFDMSASELSKILEDEEFLDKTNQKISKSSQDQMRNYEEQGNVIQMFK